MSIKSPLKTEYSNEEQDNLQIYIAQHTWERKKIYQLRYQVFVEELDKPLHSAKQQEAQLVDALDNNSILLYVEAHGEIIATARLTMAPYSDYPVNLSTIFQMQKFHTAFNHSKLLALATKLAVKKEYRSSPALYLLITEIYKILAEEAIFICFGGCNPHLIPLYERMGFRRFAANFRDEGYGLLVPIVMFLNDLDYLRSIRSPLYRQARKIKMSFDASQIFTKLFPETAKILNSRITTSQHLWLYITERLGKPLTSLPLFMALSYEAILKLLASSAVFTCRRGDYVLEKDVPCRDLYLLLTGSIALQTQKGSHLLESGEVVSCWRDLLTESGYGIARERSELLVIPRQVWEMRENFTL
jgi:predicted GNAT family N-acyltransferase